MGWRQKSRHNQEKDGIVVRLRVVQLFFVLMTVIIVARLFTLQIMKGDVYAALAAGQHELYQKLFPERGSIYVVEKQSGGGQTLFPLVTNRTVYLLYAVPSQVEDASSTANKIFAILGLPEDRAEDDLESLFADISPDLDPKLAAEIKTNRLKDFENNKKQIELDRLVAALSKPDDPYEPLRHNLTDEQMTTIKDLGLPGLGFQKELARFYPEQGIGGHIFGFWGFDGDKRVGRYGLEGRFDEDLAGKVGEIHSERDALGNLIALGQQSLVEKVDGTDLILTIDRAIQYKACGALRDAVKQYRAKGGAVVMMDPQTGAIIAMCGAPDYDPADYGQVESVKDYNNPAVSFAYEPGSIFKPITMAAAIDAGKVSPNTIFTDTGSVTIGPHTIRNFDDKTYGAQTMTQVLENSINTGVIYAMRQLTPAVFAKYVRNFGFGQKTDISLDHESTGDTRNIDTGREIYGATGSFGQGLTVTPIQMVTAISAIANGGNLVKPYLVSQKMRDGQVIETTDPQIVRRVLSPKAAAMTAGMMVSVVENGHGKHAQVDGYRVAGKTGTAQVPDDRGGYDENNVRVSFVGFAPFVEPRFAMIVMLDQPQYGKEAATTVTYTFADIAKFALQYYNASRDK